MNVTPVVKNEWYIRGTLSGWLRGPFSSLAAPARALELANEKNEDVCIECRTTVTTWSNRIVRTVSPGEVL